MTHTCQPTGTTHPNIAHPRHCLSSTDMTCLFGPPLSRRTKRHTQTVTAVVSMSKDYSSKSKTPASRDRMPCSKQLRDDDKPNVRLQGQARTCLHTPTTLLPVSHRHSRKQKPCLQMRQPEEPCCLCDTGIPTNRQCACTPASKTNLHVACVTQAFPHTGNMPARHTGKAPMFDQTGRLPCLLTQPASRGAPSTSSHNLPPGRTTHAGTHHTGKHQ